MPTVSVEKELLFSHIGQTYTDDQFDELCFEFGVELDEITSEREEIEKASAVKLTAQQLAQYSTNVIYKIDVPANRYDLLCIEGLSRGLRIFLGQQDPPAYQLTGEPVMTMTVKKPNCDKIRPFVVCAVLRDITFNEHRYQSFMDLQDQLHRNLCRQRTLVAIGTHDLDAIQPPFTYDARSPTAIDFVPLTPSDRGSFQADSLLELYETDAACKHLKPYVPIIKNSPVYPVVLDSQETVLSLPPIINGDPSKITLNTKNVFIECTATDLTKANIVLDTVVTMFSEYCAKPFTAEPVTVNYEAADGSIVSSYVTPQLYTRQERASVAFINSLIGIDLSAAEMKTLCDKVQLGPAELVENDTVLQVTVPPTRSDILHAVDIAEDVGVAYGFNNIVKKIPKTSTVGGEQPLNQLTDLVRDEIGRAGYMEVLTHGLCSVHDNFTALRRTVGPAVRLANPLNVDYQVVRTTLLPGLLMTLKHNKAASFTDGFKLFEISDVVVPDDQHVVTETVVGAKNSRRVCAVYAGPTSGFEIIHGLVDRIMTLCEVAPLEAYVPLNERTKEEPFRVSRDGWWYAIEALDESHAESPTYFPGRAAALWLTTPKQGQR